MTRRCEPSASTTSRQTAQGLDHRVRTTDKARESIRVRIRTILTRTTLGPIAGDHVVGESQWLDPRAHRTVD